MKVVAVSDGVKRFPTSDCIVWRSLGILSEIRNEAAASSRFRGGELRDLVHLARLFRAAAGEAEAVFGEDSVAEVEGV